MSQIIGLHTGQRTVAAAEWWKNWLKNNAVDKLYASDPPFNRTKNPAQASAWESIETCKINQPCYGEIISKAAEMVLQSGGNIEYGMSSFVLEKLTQTKDLIDELKSRNLNSIATRIDNYVKDVQGSNISSSEEWEQFLTKHRLSTNMELDFNRYLKNFDHDNELTSELLMEINNTKILDSDIKTQCIRWLTKLNFGPLGCFTDVVNFMEIKNDLPSILMMDAEGDDIGVLSILKKYHEQQGTTLKVVVQLPMDERANVIADYYNSMGYEILRDPESWNMKAILYTYGRQFC